MDQSTFFAYVTRGKDYGLLDHAAIQTRLHLPADQHHRHKPASGVHRGPSYAQIPISISMMVVQNLPLSFGFPVNFPVSPNREDNV
jgi:hypothetical protein